MAATTPRKKPTPAPKPQTPEEEAPQFKLSIVVHGENSSSRVVDMGLVTEGQINTVNAIVSESYDQLAKKRELFLIDVNGIGWHFNTEKINCVEVRIIPGG